MLFRSLLYDSDLVVDFLIGKLFYIASIQFNGSAGYIIETGDQADQSGFSASGTTEQLLLKAEAFALRAGGRSPRVAKQFIEQCEAGVQK